MNPLWNWFGNTFMPWLRACLLWALQTVLGPLFTFLLPVGKIFVVVMSAYEILAWSFNKVSTSVTSIDFTSIVGPNSTLLHYGAFINRFVPLQETFATVILIFALWNLVIVVRWVKSFIPTIAN